MVTVVALVLIGWGVRIITLIIIIIITCFKNTY